MCGICGYAGNNGSSRYSVDLERMNKALSHRGPDDEGFWYGDGAGLAMRRLAIIDLKTGHQPVGNEDETIWIVFNGEIYNYLDLRADLLQKGHIFRTASDTECILHLYEEEGADCVKRLRGQFAIAIWDARKKRLILARDRFGQKPLYYALVQGTLYFASELKSLFAGLPFRPEIDWQAIDAYLALQYIPDPFTAYRGVFKLLPAHTLTWENGQVSIQKYWDLPYLPKWDADEETLAGELRKHLDEAVRIRMMSEVPLGAHLSGGIDSSIVVALMAQNSGQPIRTFSIGFNEAAFSELSYARLVSKRYGTKHTEFVVGFDDLPPLLEVLLGAFGEPFADSSAIPLYHLSRLTREHVTVALNGDGGDDLLAGYLRYWLDPWADLYLKLPAWMRKTIVNIGNRLPDDVSRPVGHSWINGFKRLELLEEIPSDLSILRWSSYFFPSQRSRLWRKEMLAQLNLGFPESHLLRRGATEPALSRLDKTLYMDEMTYLPGDLLVKADRMTMANSLEGRSPFLDHVFAEFVARLPETHKLRGKTGKYLLRKAFASDLPEEVLQHRKQGFGIPLGLWFKTHLAAWAEAELTSAVMARYFRLEELKNILSEHQSGRRDHGRRIWTLIVLKAWLVEQKM